MGTQTRQYDFITGPETDSLPTIGAPTLDDDLVTLGYADSHYTQGKDAVADVAALKAIPNSGDTARVDRDVVFVDSKNALYQFDSGASDTGDDNLIITPTAGSGRWIKLAKSSEHITNLGSSGGTITDDGRYSTFLASDGGATPTVYLPTIADNDGRTITIIKNGTSDISNSSERALIISGDGGTEQIGDRVTQRLYLNQGHLMVRASATLGKWVVLSLHETADITLYMAHANGFLDSGDFDFCRNNNIITITLENDIGDTDNRNNYYLSSRDSGYSWPIDWQPRSSTFTTLVKTNDANNGNLNIGQIKMNSPGTKGCQNQIWRDINATAFSGSSGYRGLDECSFSYVCLKIMGG